MAFAQHTRFIQHLHITAPVGSQMFNGGRVVSVSVCLCVCVSVCVVTRGRSGCALGGSQIVSQRAQVLKRTGRQHRKVLQGGSQPSIQRYLKNNQGR